MGGVIILLSMFYTSCSKDNITPPENENLPEVVSNDGLIKLGKKLENPYSVSNMKKAYQSLKSKKQFKLGIKEEELTTTHLYLRFLPSDSLEYSLLLNDTTLELFTYPLDYEIEEEGDYYQDPTIVEGDGTWLYTVVPVGYHFPEMQHELLEECFIPDEEAAEENSKSTNKSNFLADLETEAMRITGNLSEEELTEIENSKSWWRPSKKYPKGTIQVEDVVGGSGNSNFQGIRRVKVRTHRIVKISRDWTDKDGIYNISRGYRRNVHYSIIFENQTGFKVWGNRAMFAPARYSMGWQSKYGHSRNFSNNSKAWLWSTINNAADDYRIKCGAFRITPPPNNMRIWSMRSNGKWAGSAPMGRQITLNINSLMDFLVIGYAAAKTSGITVALSLCLPDIFILHSGDESTRRIYETVYHESAHASHYSRVGKEYWLKQI